MSTIKTVKVFDILTKLTNAVDRGEAVAFSAEEARAFSHYLALEGEEEGARQSAVDLRTQRGAQIREEKTK